jgi:hypothetical protein
MAQQVGSIGVPVNFFKMYLHTLSFLSHSFSETRVLCKLLLFSQCFFIGCVSRMSTICLGAEHCKQCVSTPLIGNVVTLNFPSPLLSALHSLTLPRFTTRRYTCAAHFRNFCFLVLLLLDADCMCMAAPTV